VVEALRRLLPLIARHLLAHAELLCLETGDALREVRRRTFGLALAAAAGWMAVMFGCVWIIAATWDTPNRLLAVGALCIGFLVIAVLSALIANRGPRPGQPRPFERWRAEWRADLQQLLTLNASPAQPHGMAPDMQPPPGAKPQAAHVP
jgi:Putative Actinobacterial Holin-X, holin superfamily III